MKKRGRFLFWWLSLALALSYLAGLPTLAEAPTEEPLAVSMFYGGTAKIDRNGAEVLREIEKKTNTKITVVESTATEWQQKLSVLISSGTEPDIMRFGSDALHVLNKFAVDGFMKPYDGLLEEAMPTASQRISAETIAMLRNSDGKLYALPAVRDIGYGAYFYRADWLEKLGLEEPTTAEGYYEMLKAFTQGDPDGNGKDDTYGLITDVSGNFELFAGVYGVPINEWFVEEDQLVYGSTHPRMKEALAFARRIYEDGLMHPESLTMQSADKEMHITNNEIGLWHSVSSGNATMMKALRQIEPGAQSKVLKVPTAQGVEAGISSVSRIVENVDNKPKSINSFVALSGRMDEEKARRVAGFIDWFYTTDGNAAITYGIEGKTYSREGDSFTILPEYEDLEKLRALGAWDVFDAMGYIAQRANWSQLWDEETVTNMTNTAWSAWPKQVYFVTPTGEQVQFEIEEKRKEIFQQVVGGTFTVEEGWERWLSEFDRLGGNTWTEEMVAEYQNRK